MKTTTAGVTAVVEESVARLAPTDSPLTAYGRTPFAQRRARAETRILHAAAAAAAAAATTEDVCRSILRGAPDRLRDLGAPEAVIARAVALRDAPTRRGTPPDLPEDVPEEFRTYVIDLFVEGPRRARLLTAASEVVALAEEARIAILDTGRPDPGPTDVEVA